MKTFEEWFFQPEKDDGEGYFESRGKRTRVDFGGAVVEDPHRDDWFSNIALNPYDDWDACLLDQELGL